MFDRLLLRKLKITQPILSLELSIKQQPQPEEVTTSKLWNYISKGDNQSSRERRYSYKPSKRGSMKYLYLQKWAYTTKIQSKSVLKKIWNCKFYKIYIETVRGALKKDFLKSFAKFSGKHRDSAIDVLLWVLLSSPVDLRHFFLSLLWESCSKMYQNQSYIVFILLRNNGKLFHSQSE